MFQSNSSCSSGSCQRSNLTPPRSWGQAGKWGLMNRQHQELTTASGAEEKQPGTCCQGWWGHLCATQGLWDSGKINKIENALQSKAVICWALIGWCSKAELDDPGGAFSNLRDSLLTTCCSHAQGKGTQINSPGHPQVNLGPTSTAAPHRAGRADI